MNGQKYIVNDRTVLYIYGVHMDRKLINKKWSSFCEFAIDCINVGYYIYLNLDYYYLPISASYQKRHFSHDITIYGYDMNNKMFNVADFFENSAYAFKEAKFDDIENAYINYDDKGILEGRRSSILLKVNKENHINKTIFDVDLVKVLISDYLAGTNSNYRYRFIVRNINDSQAYGLDIYNVIESQLKTTI